MSTVGYKPSWHIYFLQVVGRCNNINAHGLFAFCCCDKLSLINIVSWNEDACITST